MSSLRAVFATALAVSTLVLCAGCAGQQIHYSDLDRAATSGDELPALDESAYASVDTSSSRYIGEHDGTSVWLAQGIEEDTVCLIADGGEQAWFVGCGGGPQSKFGGMGGSFTVIADGVPAPTDATQLSENVYGW